MDTNKRLDVEEQLQEVKDGFRGMNLTESKERKGENDKKSQNDPETDVPRTSDMATPEKQDDHLQTVQDGKSLRPARKLSFPPEIKIYFKRGREESDRLKKELKEAVAIKKDPAKSNIETFVKKHIIGEENKMLGPLSVSVNTVKKSDYPQYISRKVIELSLAGQVVWDTEDGKAAKGTTNFWDFNYKERKLIEAAQLYSLCKERNAPENEEEQLLPVMYWMEKKEDTTSGWRRSIRTEDGKEEVSWEKPPPKWAIDYLNMKSLLKGSEGSPKDSTGQKTVKSSGGPHRRQMTDSDEDDDGDDDENVRAEDISNVATLQQFERCNEEGSEPNKHPNAVYLLLCRFKLEGEKTIVQAYAGKATNGVEKRWLQHSKESQYLLQLYPLLTRFSALPLRVSLLVEVVVGRLYAQGGRDYITDNASTDHDNIALFVYRAYGENAKGDKKNTDAMEKTEGDLIKELELTNMKCGMNDIKPKDKKNKAENAKNAEAGDKAKTKDVKKTE